MQRLPHVTAKKRKALLALTFLNIEWCNGRIEFRMQGLQSVAAGLFHAKGTRVSKTIDTTRKLLVL